MKVLILTPNYPRKGATMNGIFIHQQVQALQKLGVECHVLLLHTWYPPLGLHKYHGYWQQGYKERQTYFDEYEGVRIHSIPMFVRMPTRLFKESFYERAVRGIAKYIQKTPELKGADWIYAHFLTDMGYIAAMLKQHINIKVAAITRGDDVHAWPESNPTLIKNIQYGFKHADLMLANNKRLAKDALKFAEDIKPNFGIVYNGVNYQDFTVNLDKNTPDIVAIKHKYGLPADKKILLCVGRNEYLKGWRELLEAIAENKEVLNEWILLAVTGNDKGKYAIDIAELTNELQNKDRVVIKPYMPFEEVKQLYKAADAFILPSYNEGISNAVMEAMASGLWVIASDVGGHAEIIEDKVSGFLVQPKSKQDIDNALRYMVNNHGSQKKQVATSARQAMEHLGDYEANARKLLAYFSQKDSTL